MAFFHPEIDNTSRLNAHACKTLLNSNSFFQATHALMTFGENASQPIEKEKHSNNNTTGRESIVK